VQWEELSGSAGEGALDRARDGDEQSLRSLIEALYAELHRLAGAQMGRERRHHSLRPTALIGEVYLRLLGSKRLPVDDRNHFLSLAARVMRRALVDHARSKKTLKRGGGFARVTLTGVGGTEMPLAEIIDVDEALTALAEEHPRAARALELEMFGGYSDEEIAVMLGMSVVTIRRDRRLALVWMRRRLGS
jgi:RNA polymerase sigma factor (TIGR02999 family)